MSPAASTAWRTPAASTSGTADRGPPRLPQHQDLRAAPGNLSHPPDVDYYHCGNCGTSVAIGGWMIASLGLSRPDSYDVMSGEPGRYDRRYHRQR
ncbi:hypothetical protein ACWGIU_09270 [Streptomyces sp. NPDC054840]